MLFGFACYGASVALDFVEGMDVKVYDPIITFFNTELHPVRHFSKLIEETFEMVGNTSLMLAFTKQLLNLSNIWSIKFSK